MVNTKSLADEIYIPPTAEEMPADIQARLQTLGEDVHARSEYYAKSAAILTTTCIALATLSAALSVIDTIPLMQDTLEMVSYSARYCSEKDSNNNQLLLSLQVILSPV